MPTHTPCLLSGGDVVGTEGAATVTPGTEEKPPADDNLVSNLGLQIILYFNLWYFPFWWSCTVIMLHLKFWQLMGYFQMVQIAILVIVSLVELIRMYLGYMGNLQEKVPELAGFWLLTCLIQVPAVLYLCLYEKLLVLPVEKALNSIYLALFLGELMTGFLALREMASQLQSRFHLRQFDHLEERAHPGPSSLSDPSSPTPSPISQCDPLPSLTTFPSCLFKKSKISPFHLFPGTPHFPPPTHTHTLCARHHLCEALRCLCEECFERRYTNVILLLYIVVDEVSW
uniref:Transmembrane protein 17 n=1 Tax=Callorhinchus milii TaxID=7868 RepID=A0A4W3JRF7_CALMI